MATATANRSKVKTAGTKSNKSTSTRRSSKKTSESVEVEVVLARPAAGKGGHRFEVEGEDKQFPVGPLYINQEAHKSMGEPERVKVTFEAV